MTELGEIDATIEYEDFRPVGEMTGLSISGDGQLLRPFKISLEDGQGRGSVQVTFHELIPNATLKPSELAHASNALPDTGRLATGTDGRTPASESRPALESLPLDDLGDNESAVKR